MSGPERFGKYVVIKRLGVGGMAEVFLCRQQGLGGFDMTVVVKRIRDDLVHDPQFIEMFLDEARLASYLHHPNVVQVFEIDVVGDTHYMAMEYVRGESLRDIGLRAGRLERLDPGYVVSVLSRICEGLHHAHTATTPDGEALELVHRDVCPSNIVVAFDGIPKLLDFGVAHARGRLARTEAGAVKGKLHYMSPEQMLALPFDRRADVYSVGVCLFELLTGAFPYPGKTFPEIAMAVGGGEQRRPSDVMADFPASLEPIVSRAIAPIPTDRYASCEELHLALEGWLASEGGAADRDTLAAWLDELFPDEGRTRRASAGATPVSLCPSTSQPFSPAPPHGRQGAPTPSVREAPSPAVWGLASMLGVALVVIGGLGAFVALQGDGPTVSATSPPRVVARTLDVAAPPAAPVVRVALEPAPWSADAAARAYLTEIERLAAAKQYGPALELLAKAKELRGVAPTLVIALVQTGSRLQSGRRLHLAQALLGAGAAAEAIAAAKSILDADPDNQQAIGLIRDAREALSPEPEPEIVEDAAPEDDRKHEQGRLSVTSTPQGMVYVDDRPIGATPILNRAVRAGRRAVEVRAAGHTPFTERVRVRAGKKRRVKVALEKVTVTTPPKSDGPGEASAPTAGVAGTAPTTKPATDLMPQAAAPKVKPPKAKAPEADGGAYQPRLSRKHVVTEARQVVMLLRVVENEAIAGGLAMSKVRDCTFQLARALATRLGRDKALELRPRAVYRLILEAAAANGRDGISQRLLGAAHGGSIVRVAPVE